MPSGRSAYEKGSSPRARPRLWLIVAAVAVSVLVAGVVVLGVVDVAPSPQSVEKVIPGDRSSR